MPTSWWICWMWSSLPGELDAGATILFQLVSARYERGSIILTSNKSYGDWGTVFGDHIIATAPSPVGC